MGDEDPSEVLNKFELLLKSVEINKTNSVYSKNKQGNVNAKFKKPVKSAQDILLNVSSQIKNLHRADIAKNVKKNRDILFKSNKALVPVNKLPVNDEIKQQPAANASKFETQGFSTSQLLHIIQDAEAIESNSGVTQEFNVTFYPECTKTTPNEHTNKVDNIENEVTSQICNNLPKIISDIPEANIITENCNTSTIQKEIEVSEKEFQYNLLDNEESNKDSNNIEAVTYNSQEIDDIDINLTQVYNEAKPLIEPATQVSKDARLSPILKPVIKINTEYLKCDSPLIFDLEDFERFEKIAIPIIENNTDLNIARALINSRINEKEHIADISTPFMVKEETVDGFSSENSKNVEKLNINNVSTISSDSYIEKDFKMKELTVNILSKSLENEVLNSALEEKIHVNDEILFSSDKEDPYYKNYQDLPFTCALETSFYDQSDILDKTMFVGFQTASNKAIQIRSDSFYKANSFLSDCVSGSKELSLTDLVKKCETIDNKIHEKLKDDTSKDPKLDFETKQLNSNVEDKEINLDGLTASSKVIADPFGSTVTNDVSEKRFDVKVEASDNYMDIPEKAVNDPTEYTVTNHCKGKSIDEDKLCLDLDAEKLKLFDDDILKEFENDEILFVDNSNEDKVVGFKTASKKNIPISDAAFQKTKDLFNNLDIEQFSKPVKFAEEDKICVKQEQSAIEFVGFKTASNKKINISEETLAKSKNLFKDIDGFTSECMNTSKSNNNNKACLGFMTASNKQIIVSDAALVKSRNILENFDDRELSEHGATKIEIIGNRTPGSNPCCIEDAKFVENDNDTHKSNIFEGFKTASNKNIHISEKARLACTKIFQDIDMNDNNPVKTIPEPSKGILVKKFEGFQTASNKPVNISEAALAKSRMLLKSVDESNFPLDHEPSGHECKDKERNKFNKIINDALKTEIDFDKGSEEKGLNTPFKGFINDSKDIRVSKLALNQARDLSESINKHESNSFPKEKAIESAKFVRFHTASNKPVKISEKALNKGILVKKFEGFQTASNKPVNISEAALAKSRMLLKSVDESNFPLDHEPSGHECKDKERNKFNKIINDALKTEIDFDKGSEEKGLNTPFKGFINDSKDIRVSKLALNQARDLSESINKHESNSFPKEKAIESAKFVGFHTASNKPVKISEKALAKSKILLQGFHDTVDKENYNQKNEREDNCIINTDVLESRNLHENCRHTINKEADSNPIFIGFQTASNKSVKISEKALAKSKMLFQGFHDTVDKENYEDACNINTDVQESPNLHENCRISINKEANSNPIFIGFQTASNKSVKISDEAFAQSKRLFLELEDNIHEKTVVTEINNRFVAASNKKESVISEATIKTRNQMQVNKENGDLISNIKDNAINTAKFVGFQTASKKAVVVSEEALAKSKRLFDDLEVPTHSYDTKFNGFETASNKKVKVSEDAISKTKNLFKDFDLIEMKDPAINKIKMSTDSHRAIKNKIHKPNTGTITSPKVHSEVAKIYHNIFKDLENNADANLSTQILNNFDQTLCTEDFASNYTPVKRSPKRCSSPILSCPRAKKRKRFETPYRNKSDKVIISNLENPIPKTENGLKFDSNYKKNKRYTLKDICSLETYSAESIGPDPYIKKFNFENLLDFVFSKHRNDINETELTINNLKTHFLNSVNKKIVPENWFEIHVRLILWKLLSYELKFPNMMDGICTAKNVVDQLKYRYDRELYQVQRPALRKIFEKDETSSRVIVLCVVGVFAEGVLCSAPKSVDNLELLLSDGWYTIMVTLDKMLCNLVYDEKIKVGCKLVTQGAELVNCEQGIAPWEDTTSVRLKLYGNSTRRARWDARLGFHGNAAILSHLSAVRPDGGKVSKLRLFVTRVYPALYVEKFEDGSTVTRSERLEQLYQMKYESDRQRAMEKIYEEVEKEFSDQESQDSEVIVDTVKRRCLDTGSQIARTMKISKDPSEFRATLTSSQVRQLQEHNQYKREQLLQEIQKRVEEKIGGSSLKVGRNVVAVLKARVAGVKDGNITNGLLSIWKPNDAISDIVAEGAWIDVSNVVPTAVRYSEIHLSAGRQTLFRKNKLKHDDSKQYTEKLKRKCCHIKNLNLFPVSTAEYNEIDTVGMVVLVEPSSKDFEISKKQPFQNIFLADSEKKLICVNFWGGLKKFGFELVLDTGQIVACMNLQKRAGNTKKNIPQYRATEFSFFTKTPKNEALRKSIEELVKEISGIDRRKFCDDCVAIKNNYGRIGLAGNNENVSPYRFNTSDYNFSKNKIFIDSPLANNKCDLNLTGLDFESTFVQVDTQELSPKTLMRKKKLNERIAKLKMYGEPPPLSPMHIINKSKNASSSYKSPLASKSNSTISVPRNLPLDESPISSITKHKSDSSPIISVVNRTFTKNVNPTRLNFSNNVAMDKNVSSDLVDHFAEEFDGSPPLSLDSTSC